MSKPSPLPAAGRRVPVQERSERRVATFLGHAAALIAEAGYAAATMTEIAQRAGASIGAVYQYFPNKEAIVRALRNRYGEEMESRWALIETDMNRLDAAGLSARIVDLMVEFADQRPAFFPLLSAPVNIPSDSPVRQRIRERFARMFRMKNPGLSKEESLRIANVTLQTIRGLNILLSEARPRDRAAVEAEYKTLIVGYLGNRLETQASKM
jgi:AcrR family transcriptional regulator